MTRPSRQAEGEGQTEFPDQNGATMGGLRPVAADPPCRRPVFSSFSIDPLTPIGATPRSWSLHIRWQKQRGLTAQRHRVRRTTREVARTEIANSQNQYGIRKKARSPASSTTYFMVPWRNRMTNPPARNAFTISASPKGAVALIMKPRSKFDPPFLLKASLTLAAEAERLLMRDFAGAG
jgi:hypothetical protein